MKPTVYIETTIPSYLVARPSPFVVVAGEQELTREWWNGRAKDFQLFVSQLVVSEASRGDAALAAQRLAIINGIPELDLDEGVDALAERINQAQIIPEKASADILHVAVAARHGMDFLMTWNCRHIANAQLTRKLNEVVTDAGYRMPVICTPLELMGDNNHDA